MSLKIFKTNENCVTTIWDSRKDTVGVNTHAQQIQFSIPFNISNVS